MNKIILDLCGGSGSWAKPYSDAGYIKSDYDLRSITPPAFALAFFDANKQNKGMEHISQP